MWRDVELRELRIFLVLADELHFGRTAERLGISQPGVSEAVRALESRLGIKVSDRTSRRVRLTSAGEEFRRKLAPALAALEQTLAGTGDLSGDVGGLLRVGFVLTTEGPPLSRLVAAFHDRYPGCEVRLQEVETFDAYRALRGGDIDVLCNWLAVDEPDLTAGTAFAYYPRALAVAPSHRLAGQATVSVEELASEEVAQFPPTTPSAVYDLLVPPRTPSGRPIRRTVRVRTINEILAFVARGRIVHPTSSTVPMFDRDDIVLVPIDDLPRYRSGWSGPLAGRTRGSAPLMTPPVQSLAPPLTATIPLRRYGARLPFDRHAVPRRGISHHVSQEDPAREPVGVDRGRVVLNETAQLNQGGNGCRSPAEMAHAHRQTVLCA